MSKKKNTTAADSGVQGNDFMNNGDNNLIENNVTGADMGTYVINVVNKNFCEGGSVMSYP